MPTLLIWRGHKFRFYALDVGEPPHVHIVKEARSLKLWLRSLEVAHNKGYSDQEVGRLLKVASEHRDEWLGVWSDFFGL
jgi:ribosome modulation factor